MDVPRGGWRPKFSPMAGRSKLSPKAFQPRPPKWPGAFELARAGTPIGVCALPYGDGATVAAAVIDVDGVLWQLARLRPWQFSHWCIARHVRWYPSLGELVTDLQRRRCVGWVHDRIVEVEGSRRFVVAVEPLRAVVNVEEADDSTVSLS